jgi:predicted amidohydrolase YtcJ
MLSPAQGWLNRQFIGAVSLTALILSGCQPETSMPQAQDDQAPVVIYTAKEIVTMDTQRPTAEAVAIEDDRIIAVGSVADITETLAETRYRIDDRFNDQVLVPGLINQHDHPWLAALMMSTQILAIEDWEIGGKSFPRAANETQYREKLKALLAQHTDSSELFGSWGYHRLWHGDLNRAMLDEMSPDVPVFIWQRSGHEFIMNSKALERFNITAATVSQLSDSAQAQANLERGHFWEQGAMAMVPVIFEELAEPQRYIASLKMIRDYWHAAGSTWVVEPGGLVNKGMMTLQNQVFSGADNPFHMDYIADGKTMAHQYLDGDIIGETEKLMDWGEGMSQFIPKQVKLFADGAIFSQLMKMQDGYLDGHHGEWIIDPDKLEIAFAKYWDAGYQIHVHQNGDEGLEVVLDIIEANLKRNPREDHRTVIVHFGFSTKEQVQRIAKLGVIVSANPYYAVALTDTYSEVGIGPERAQEMVRLGDVVDANVSLSLHSDMPMAPGKPLFLMWSAVNRISLEGNLVGPAQRLTPEQALKAVTLDAAYSMQLENDLGSIETGKIANITVLAENPLTVDPMTIKDIDVWGTLHEGRVLPVH